jgi:hypothetical protein
MLGNHLHAPAPPNPSKEWKKFKLKMEDILTLVNNDILREKVVDGWNAATGDAYPMEKNSKEIPMFSRFVERRLALPASDFFRGHLNFYDIKHIHMKLNGIFHTFVFIHFCEAFVGIKPH